jgi:putative aminopeptidase FrvX
MASEYTPSERPAVRDLRLLRRLTEAASVSGSEGAVRAIVREQVEPYADEIQTDALGNLTVRCKGRSPNRPRVMLAAHMDEVGLIVTAIDNDGAIHFEAVGWIDTAQLPGKPVWIGKERLPGVIGASPIQPSIPGDSKRLTETKDMRIDIGAKSKEEADGKVKLGEQVVFASKFIRLGSVIRAKALDDRLGVATLIEIVQHAPPEIDLLAAFTVQEEVGLRGAQVAAYRMEPDLAIAVDCTPARDLPTWDGEENMQYNTRLGKGPAIYVNDHMTIADPRLLNLLIETAEYEGIPYQLRQPGGGGTDAGAIHLSRAGVPSISLSVPGRYAHSPAGFACIADWRASARLLYASLRRLNSSILSHS